ncbi:MAG TPA: ATP-binding protein [Caulobacteraceae bacterium]|jgi:hypothetical protein
MISKSINEIELSDLLALKGTARESKTLEFKRELPTRDGGARKLVASVTGLANASGGDLVLGVVEKAGVAVDVPGVLLPDIDAYKLQIEQVIASLVEPPLPRVDLREIDCGYGRWAIVIRVAQSWTGPHRSRADNHFYVRTSAATVPLGVSELRAAFGLRENAVQRIEAFRTERLLRITNGATPVPLHPGPVVVLHLAPLPSFANRDLLDIVTMIAEGTHMPLPLRGFGDNRPRVNLFGLLVVAGETVPTSEYAQVFRSGAYEGTSCAAEADAGRYLASVPLANAVVRGVTRYLALQDSYGIAFPTFAMLSICDAKGLRMRTPTEFGGGFYETPPLEEETVAFPEFVLEGPNVDVAAVLRPLLNIVWNAFGLARARPQLADSLGGI